MINYLSNWAGELIVVVLVASIFEMMIPEGKNKKYVNSIIGLFVLFTIISPIIKDKVNFSDYENLLASSSNITTTVVNENKVLIDNYKSNLENDLSAKLIEKGYTLKYAEFFIETINEENFGMIYGMDIIVEKNTDTETTNSIVEKVDISIGNSDTEEIKAEDCTALKEYLSSEYQVDIEKVRIK